MEVEIILFSVRQLPDKVLFSVRQLPDEATEHLHGERGGGGQAGVRDNEIGNSGFLFFLKISQVKVLTFFTFSEHVGPSHGHLKPQPSILKAECNISWFLLDV